jgi:hypothetical protein
MVAPTVEGVLDHAPSVPLVVAKLRLSQAKDAWERTPAGAVMACCRDLFQQKRLGEQHGEKRTKLST